MIRLAKRAVLVVALVGLLAALNLSSASATRLCTVPGVGAACPAPEDIVPKEMPIKLFLLGKTNFEIGLTNVECNESFLAGFTKDEGGAGGVPVGVKFTNNSFTECGSCEVDVTFRPTWHGGFSGTGNQDGSLLFENEFEFKCGKEVCIYEAFEGTKGIVNGGEPAIVEILVQKLTLRSNTTVKCVQYPKWTSVYEIISPSPLYVTEN